MAHDKTDISHAGPRLKSMNDSLDEIALLRQQRDHWMRTAMAFDEHLATMRVMWMEQPALRFGALETWMPTDAERKAVEVVTTNYQQLCDKYGASEEDDATLSTLRSLLARVKHGK